MGIYLFYKIIYISLIKYRIKVNLTYAKFLAYYKCRKILIMKFIFFKKLYKNINFNFFCMNQHLFTLISKIILASTTSTYDTGLLDKKMMKGT